MENHLNYIRRPESELTPHEAIPTTDGRILEMRRYLRAIVLSCQMGGGANPLNLCYTTHVGDKWPLSPLHLDSRHTGQLPPEGLTVFGPVAATADDPFIKAVIRPHCYPDPEKWPIMEAYWDVFWYPMMCEFTIHHPMACNAYTWGYLAGLETR